MWPSSPEQEVWHQAISDLVTHQGDCLFCSPDGAPRCQEAQRLYGLEQAAWRASVAERYAGVAS
jgi:hypothetical protein